MFNNKRRLGFIAHAEIMLVCVPSHDIVGLHTVIYIYIYIYMKNKLDLINPFRIKFHLSKSPSFTCSEMGS